MQNEKKTTDQEPCDEWASDGTELVEPGPFEVRVLRWTKGSGVSAASQAEINRSVETYAPIYLLVFGNPYEVRPSPLYLALDELPLEGASNEVLRAYVALREQVIEDIKDFALRDLRLAMESD